MKKTIILLAAALIAMGASAQSGQLSKEELQRSFRQTIQKRDVSKRHLTTGIPVKEAPATKGTAKSLPEDRVWFPGEWEEVQAICVTPYYSYLVPGHESSYYWMADPMVTGLAAYYQYSGMQGWQEQGMGPYVSEMDTSSTFGKVFFYLMDGIQLGGAEAWVRVEQVDDTAKVLRTLARMNLRHDNVKFLVGAGNSFWYRDCGPICFYYGDQDSVAMLDFTYYPGRALDDSLPSIIHTQMGIPNYITKVEWEGGNCLVDGAGMVLSSDAIYANNNDGYGQLTWDGQDVNSLRYSNDLHLNRARVREALQELLGQRATYILPAYQYDGGTGHVDLYADAWDENGFVFSVMPEVYSSWSDYVTGQKNIDSLCSYMTLFDRNYYVMGTLPFPSKDNGSNFNSQTEYDNNYTRTYSNHTFVNNVILQPCFSAVVNGQPSAQWDRENIEQVAAAYPGYTIYPVDVRDFDGSGGAIHCVTKQIPAENPIRILHKNIHDTIVPMQQVPVSAIITNKSGIAHAEVLYRDNEGEWQTVNLTANGNRFYGNIPTLSDEDAHTVEYYISATSNNGKTITKPMTAGQGGYYSFTYNGGTPNFDSTMFDYETTAMAMEDITFLFGTEWANEDTSYRGIPEPPVDDPDEGIEDVNSDKSFGQFYPNPASDMAYLNVEMGDGESYMVSIVDAAGRTVHTSSLQAAGSIIYSINTARLAEGMYTVVFQGQNSRVIRKLIVK